MDSVRVKYRVDDTGHFAKSQLSDTITPAHAHLRQACLMHDLSTTANRASTYPVSIACLCDEFKSSIFCPNCQALTLSPAISIADAPPPSTVRALTKAGLLCHTIILVRLCVEQKLQLRQIQKPPLAASRPRRVNHASPSCCCQSARSL